MITRRFRLIEERLDADGDVARPVSIRAEDAPAGSTPALLAGIGFDPRGASHGDVEVVGVDAAEVTPLSGVVIRELVASGIHRGLNPCQGFDLGPGPGICIIMLRDRAQR